MTETLDFEVFRRAKRPSYVPMRGILDLCNQIEGHVDEIVVGSLNAFNVIDPLAAEIMAYLNAIRRVLDPEEAYP